MSSDLIEFFLKLLFCFLLFVEIKPEFGTLKLRVSSDKTIEILGFFNNFFFFKIFFFYYKFVQVLIKFTSHVLSFQSLQYMQ